MGNPLHQSSSRRTRKNNKVFPIKGINPDSTIDAKRVGDQIAGRLKLIDNHYNDGSWSQKILEEVELIKQYFFYYYAYQAIEFIRNIGEPFGGIRIFQMKEIHNPICTAKSHARRIYDCSGALSVIVPISEFEFGKCLGYEVVSALIEENSTSSSVEHYLDLYGGFEIAEQIKNLLKVSGGVKSGIKSTSKSETKLSDRKTEQIKLSYNLFKVSRIVLIISDEFIALDTEYGFVIRSEKDKIDEGPFWPDYSLVGIRKDGSASVKAWTILKNKKLDDTKKEFSRY